MRAIRRTALIGVAAVAAATAMGTGTASAGTTAHPVSTAKHTVYVGPRLHSPGRSGGHAAGSCGHPDASSVQGGVDLVATGGTVVVCRGTYAEQVDITRTLTLQGRHGAVIDATGKPYGVGIGADHVTVTGLTVTNAGVNAPPAAEGAPPSPNDGIVTASLKTMKTGNYARIVDDVATGNRGAGIDVNSTHGTLVQHVRSTGNGIAINMADDLMLPAYGNKILDNVASGSTDGCGIVLADHTGVGVRDNVVKGNTADDNSPNAYGAGILIASPVPTGGIVKNNLIQGNEAHGNGLSGFMLHGHAPGGDYSGNKVIGNRFGTNNVTPGNGTTPAGDFADPQTTGIYLGSNTPLSILVVDNTISHDAVGIFVIGTVNLVAHHNTFHDVGRPVVVSSLAYAG